MKCVFCEIPNEEYILENSDFFLRFDLFPISPGHTEIIPKRHVSTILELNNEEWTSLKDFMEMTNKYLMSTDLIKVYDKLIKSPICSKSEKFINTIRRHRRVNSIPGGFNYGINEGKVAGQTIPHLHIHVIPRFEGDVENPEGGVRNVIPGLGKYK